MHLYTSGSPTGAGDLLVTTTVAEGLGSTVELVGDVDADGAADLAVASDRTKAVRVFYGPLPSSGTLTTGDAGLVVTGLSVDRVGAAGDLDGDGFDDLWAGNVNDAWWIPGGLR